MSYFKKNVPRATRDLGTQRDSHIHYHDDELQHPFEAIRPQNEVLFQT